ncbi:SWIM zinc finger family protein [Micromonospora sagamiensis]|uniref:Putative Zn finger protein n=1 Tax=Micromonospora sagamiensis TaxID=47875 RepID=A0A562WG20_9ACTN|nr:SWIM zinc finger family protein [Micromonospora sagamiensis]TWJ29186.1 putative Zn finger protein [Micromonospora sagamiensis]BCL17789.1 hypothetical protein GCM10017556_55280 [Micromonospora sagamiensis]
MTARGFPAFAPGRARRVRSWWATAWLRTWDDVALDQRPLRRGRRYAVAGHVGPVTVSAGRVAAAVHDGDPERAHRAVVRVARLADADWGRLGAAVTDRTGHLAALLARHLPDGLPDDAGVPLLPGVADLTPECDCPDWEHPCRHVAALVTQVAWLLDTDPFLLLLMRGRDEAGFLAGIRVAEEPGPAGDGSGRAGDDEPPGESPHRAYARPVAALPAAAGPPGGPVTPPLFSPAAGVDPEQLRGLVARAAARAAALLGGG